MSSSDSKSEKKSNNKQVVGKIPVASAFPIGSIKIPIYSLIGASVLGFAARYVNAEGFLQKHITDADLKALFVLSGFLVFFVNSLMTGLTINARITLRIPPPLIYPTDDDVRGDKERRQRFLCAVRAHENYQEWLLPVLVLVFVNAFFGGAPRLAAVSFVFWNVARILYGYGYATGNPGNRSLGFILSTFSILPLYGNLFFYCIEYATHRFAN
mmetsp:Transcript_9661/g.16319  ORF Transcript_9661/g.16319 Transcript_9661/m.16319 type:complete len:213 (+) Transcript_9661:77-715(+)